MRKEIPFSLAAARGEPRAPMVVLDLNDATHQTALEDGAPLTTLVVRRGVKSANVFLSASEGPRGTVKVRLTVGMPGNDTQKTVNVRPWYDDGAAIDAAPETVDPRLFPLVDDMATLLEEARLLLVNAPGSKLPQGSTAMIAKLDTMSFRIDRARGLEDCTACGETRPIGSDACAKCGWESSHAER